jgi:hypothetical protein
MPNQMPPVPPGNRSSAGPDSAAKPDHDTAPKKTRPENIDQQGDRANVAQNTSNQVHPKQR